MPPRTVLPSIQSSSCSISPSLSDDTPRPRLPLPPIGHGQLSSSSSLYYSSVCPEQSSSGSESVRSHLMDELDFSTNKNTPTRPKSASTSKQDGKLNTDSSTDKSRPSDAESDSEDVFTLTPTNDDSHHEMTRRNLQLQATAPRRRSSTFSSKTPVKPLLKKKTVVGKKKKRSADSDGGRSSSASQAESVDSPPPLEVSWDVPTPDLTSDARKYVDDIVTRTYVGEVIQGAVRKMVERPKAIEFSDSLEDRSDSGLHLKPPIVFKRSLVQRRITLLPDSTSPPPHVLVPSFEPHHTRESYPHHPLVQNLPTCVFNRFHGKRRKLNKLVSHKVLVDFVCPRAPTIPPANLMTESCLTLRRYYHQLECSKWYEWTHVSGKRRNSEVE